MTTCKWRGCKAPPAENRQLCEPHLAYFRRKYSERTKKAAPKEAIPSSAVGLSPCTVEVRNRSKGPPWPEMIRIGQNAGICPGTGIWRVATTWTINPDRPQRWLEVINAEKGIVVMRTLKPAEKIRPLLEPGDQIVLAVRIAERYPFTAVKRYWL